MPCYDPTAKEEEQARFDRLTRLLCWACRMLERSTYDWALNLELKEWWREHKAWDLDRKRRESEAP